MIPQAVECPCCGAVIDVRTYRKFVQCPYCGIRTPFDGFEYENIDWRSSMYAHVKLWMDCPACRSGNMYLGPSGKCGTARTADTGSPEPERTPACSGSAMIARHF